MIFDFQRYAEVHFHAVLLRERVKRVFHSAAYAEEEGKIPVFSEQQGKRVRVAFENGDDFVDGNFLIVGYAELHFFEDGVLYLSQHFGHVGKVFVKRAAVVTRGRGYLAYGYFSIPFSLYSFQKASTRVCFVCARTAVFTAISPPKIRQSRQDCRAKFVDLSRRGG